MKGEVCRAWIKKGTGYVGLRNAFFLDRRSEVVALYIITAKVDMINARRSPIDNYRPRD